jgi:large subunit ribosomal protein L25
MIVDWQKDPVKDTLLHIDMKRIDLTVRLVVKVPVHTEGEPEGVKTPGRIARSHHARNRSRVPAQ